LAEDTKADAVELFSVPEKEKVVLGARLGKQEKGV
jgi:hypothetical protein